MHTRFAAQFSCSLALVALLFAAACGGGSTPADSVIEDSSAADTAVPTAAPTVTSEPTAMPEPTATATAAPTATPEAVAADVYASLLLNAIEDLETRTDDVELRSEIAMDESTTMVSAFREDTESAVDAVDVQFESDGESGGFGFKYLVNSSASELYASFDFGAPEDEQVWIKAISGADIDASEAEFQALFNLAVEPQIQGLIRLLEVDGSVEMVDDNRFLVDANPAAVAAAGRDTLEAFGESADPMEEADAVQYDVRFGDNDRLESLAITTTFGSDVIEMLMELRRDQDFDIPEPSAGQIIDPSELFEPDQLETIANLEVGRIGGCYATENDLFASVETPCTTTHAYEVFAMGAFDDPIDVAYPGGEALLARSTEVCGEAYRAVTGVHIELTVRNVLLVYPLANTWVRGDRGWSCAGFTDDGVSVPMSELDARRTESTVSPFFVDAGDCLPDDLAAIPLSIVPCDEEHYYETFHTVVLDEGTYPGDEAISAAAASACEGAAFESFVGVPYAESEWFVEVFTPYEYSWDEYDDRIIACFLTTYGPETGTAANSAR